MDRTLIIIKGLSDSISPIIGLIITFTEEIELDEVIDFLTFHLISVVSNKTDGTPTNIQNAPWDTSQFLPQFDNCRGIRKIEVVTSEPLRDIVPNSFIDFSNKLKLALLSDKDRLRGSCYFYAIYSLGWFNTNIIKLLSWLVRHGVNIIHPQDLSRLEDKLLFCLVYANILATEFHYLVNNYYARIAISIYDLPAEKLCSINKTRLLKHSDTIGKHPKSYYIWFDMIMTFLISQRTKIEGQYLRRLVKKHGISREIEDNITTRGVDYLLGIICKNMTNPTLDMGQWLLFRFKNQITTAIYRSKLCDLINKPELLIEIALLEFQVILEIKKLVPEVWDELLKEPSLSIITVEKKTVTGILAVYSCLFSPWTLPGQAPDILLYYLQELRPYLESKLLNVSKPHVKEFDYISSYTIGELKRHLALDYWKRNKHLFSLQKEKMEQELSSLERDTDYDGKIDYLRVAVEQENFNKLTEETEEVTSDEFIEALLKELGLDDDNN